MYPRKNAQRGYRERVERRRRKKAAQGQPVSPPKEGDEMNDRNVNIGLGCLAIFLVIAALCAVVFFIWNPIGLQLTTAKMVEAPAPAVTQAPIVVEVVYPTAAPVEPSAPIVESTQVSPTDAPAPVAVSCDTPSIKAGLSAADAEFGEFLDTNLGKRMTFTSRRLLVPSKEWNDPLSPEELKTVEQTWQTMQVCIPDGTTGVIFAGGIEQGVNRYETGALLSLKPGLYEFRMRNGEAVIWYPNQDSFAKNDLERIVSQIRTGNFDIKSPLAFFAATADLFSQIPQDLVKERNVQIAPPLDPTVQ